MSWEAIVNDPFYTVDGTTLQSGPSYGGVTLEDGDVCVMSASVRSEDAFTVPSGWILDTDAETTGADENSGIGVINTRIYYAIRDGSDPGLGFVFSDRPAYACLTVYRHSGGAAAFAGAVKQQNASYVDPVPLAGGIAAAASDSLVVVACGNGGAQVTNFCSSTNIAGTTTQTHPDASNWSKRSDAGNATGPYRRHASFDAVLASPGSTGDIAVDIAAARPGAVVALVFEPVAPPADTDAPTFTSAPATSGLSSTQVTISATINEPGDIFYVVVPQAATNPTPTEVIAGTASGGGAAVANGSALAGTSLNATITGLTANTAYKAVVVARDDEGTPNVQAAVTTVNFTTPISDTAAPVYTVAPAISSIGGTSANLTASINEIGDIFYVIVPQAATTPSVSEVIAGTASGGGAATDAGSALAGTTLDDLLSGLTAGTAYKAVVVARDDEPTPNVQSAVTVVNFTTAGSDGVLTSSLLQNGSDVAIADGTNVTVKVISMTTGTDILKVDTTVASQRVTITSGAIETGTLYGLVVIEGGVNIAAETLTAT